MILNSFILIILILYARSQSYSYQLVGLYSKDNLDSTLPLQYITINGTIQNGFAKLEMVQIYYNPCNKPIETTFYYPKDKDTVFTGFQAIISNQTIIGKVEEKQIAREIYLENLKEGKTVAYADINQFLHDVLQIDIGNIQPGQTIKIKFIYIQPIDIAFNKLWTFTILSTLTPRYIPFSSSNSNLTTNLPNMQQQIQSESTYTWNISLDIIDSSPIDIIYSPTHSILINYSTNKKTASIVLDPKIKQIPNKDFIIYYKTNNPYQPQVIVEKFQQDNSSSNVQTSTNDYIALVTFFPQLNSISDQEALQIIESSNSSPNDININIFKKQLQFSKGEFIFMVDRSGSMDGEQMITLKTTLNTFLNNLPLDSLYNIISFGSVSEIMYGKSLPNTPNNIASTSVAIQKFQANYGGTEIIRALSTLDKLPLNPNYPRNVILLTDGDITNPNDVITYINSHTKQTKYCTVGIGNGVSTYLIEAIANVGHCSYEYIKNNNEINTKVLSLLQSATLPYIADFLINFACITGGCNINNNQIGGVLAFLNDSESTISSSGPIKALLPDTKNLPFIVANKPFKMWIYFNEAVIKGMEKISMTLSYKNYYNNVPASYILIIDLASAKGGEVLHEVGYNDLNNQLILQSILQPNLQDNIVSVIIKNSLTYQILSEYTAFILVSEIVTNNTTIQKPIKVNIPNIASTNVQQASGGVESFSAKAPVATMIMPTNKMSSPARTDSPIFIPFPIPFPGSKINQDLCGGNWLNQSVLSILSSSNKRLLMDPDMDMSTIDSHFEMHDQEISSNQTVNQSQNASTINGTLEGDTSVNIISPNGSTLSSNVTLSGIKITNALYLILFIFIGLLSVINI